MSEKLMYMQNQDDKSRRPFQDMGIFLSVCIFIIMTIRCAMFGFSWASIVWLVMVLVYWCYSYVFMKHGKDKMLVWGTSVFILSSLLVLVSIVFFDKNARPKMQAFEGAAVDSVTEEEFIVDETPDIIVMEKKDTVVSDSSRTDSSANVNVNAEASSPVVAAGFASDSSSVTE